MIKAKLSDSERVGFITLELPQSPSPGDYLGLWIDGEWEILKVDYTVYEFDKENKYIIAEINVS